MTPQSGFGDVDFYQQKKDIVTHFDAIVPRLKALNKGYYYLQAVQRFRDALTFTTRDLGKLPVYCTTVKSLTKSKTNCVLCILCHFVVHYWAFCDKAAPFSATEFHLEQLEDIANSGLDAFEIKGDKHPGYYLERKK